MICLDECHVEKVESLIKSLSKNSNSHDEYRSCFKICSRANREFYFCTKTLEKRNQWIEKIKQAGYKEQTTHLINQNKKLRSRLQDMIDKSRKQELEIQALHVQMHHLQQQEKQNEVPPRRHHYSFDSDLTINTRKLSVQMDELAEETTHIAEAARTLQQSYQTQVLYIQILSLEPEIHDLDIQFLSIKRKRNV